jgi:hypothetical protein
MNKVMRESLHTKGLFLPMMKLFFTWVPKHFKCLWSTSYGNGEKNLVNIIISIIIIIIYMTKVWSWDMGFVVSSRL